MGPRASLDGRKISSPPGFDPGLSSLLTGTEKLFGVSWIMSSLRTRTPIIRLKPFYKNSVIVLCFRILPSEARSIPCTNRTSSLVSEFDIHIARHAVVRCVKERFKNEMLFLNTIRNLSKVF